MVLSTGVNHLDAFHHTDRIRIKTSPDFRLYAVSPFLLLPFFLCCFNIRKSSANSELRIETFHGAVTSCLPLACEMLSVRSILHRFGGYVLSKSSF